MALRKDALAIATVPENHPLIILANALPWEKMLQLIEHDLGGERYLSRPPRVHNA